MNPPNELSVDAARTTDALPAVPLTLDEIKAGLEEKYGESVVVEEVGERDGKRVVAVRMGRPVRPLAARGIGITQTIGDLLVENPAHQVGPEIQMAEGTIIKTGRAVGKSVSVRCEMPGCGRSGYKTNGKGQVLCQKHAGGGRGPIRYSDAAVGRNDRCSCGSGKKFKACCRNVKAG